MSREHLKEKALHALFSLRRHLNLRKLKISLACKTFDTMMSPILTHNSEIWGVYAKPDTKTSEASQIGKTHLQFCKRYSAVNNKASNITCSAEIGHFPLNVTINQKILNYMLYIHSKDEESFVKQSFLMSFDLYCSSGSSFHSHNRVFQKFVPIVNCILQKAFHASLSKCKLIQVRNLSK